MMSAIHALPRSSEESTSEGLLNTRRTVKLGDASKRLTSSRLACERSPSATTIGTFLTSVVAAYARTTSWRIGASTTMPNRRGSCHSSISSFQMRNRIRLISAPLAAQPQRGEEQDDARIDHERHELGPDHGQPHSLENDSAQGDEKVPRRHDVGHGSKECRHARDRKDE